MVYSLFKDLVHPTMKMMSLMTHVSFQVRKTFIFGSQFKVLWI